MDQPKLRATGWQLGRWRWALSAVQALFCGPIWGPGSPLWLTCLPSAAHRATAAGRTGSAGTASPGKGVRRDPCPPASDPGGTVWEHWQEAGRCSGALRALAPRELPPSCSTTCGSSRWVFLCHLPHADPAANVAAHQQPVASCNTPQSSLPLRCGVCSPVCVLPQPRLQQTPLPLGRSWPARTHRPILSALTLRRGLSLWPLLGSFVRWFLVGLLADLPTGT